MPIGDQTNQLYRKEYFVDARQVLTSGRDMAKSFGKKLSPVLRAGTVRVSDQTVVVHGTAQAQIRVDTIREGTKITGLRVVCPCGRTAEMKVKYEN
ncbi:MAG: hypothetical protein WCN95_06095 [bacterium]